MATIQNYLVQKRRAAVLSRLDFVIRKLTHRNVKKGKFADLTEHEISELAIQVTEELMNDPVCIDVDLSQPLYILGDIFGQHCDLLNIFDTLGYPPKQRYLFLGNYCDRGRQSIEVLCLLFAFKLKFPKSIFLLRGNHECEYITCHYGFLSECTTRYSQDLWRIIMNTFNCLPAAAIIEGCIFCVHSGMIPCIEYSTMTSQDELRLFICSEIKRPTTLIKNFLLTQLTWSEPVVDAQTWHPNPVGLGRHFSENVVEHFCERFGFQLVIRSNELLQTGYEFAAHGKLLTIFTASNFGDCFTNLGALVYLKKNKQHNKISGRIKTMKSHQELTRHLTPYRTMKITDSLASGDTSPTSKLTQMPQLSVVRFPKQTKQNQLTLLKA